MKSRILSILFLIFIVQRILFSQGFRDIQCVAIIGNYWYAGGAFDSYFYEGTAASNIIRFNGSTWESFGGGVNDYVHTFATIGSDLYVGGNFTQAGSLAVNHIVKWNGSNWSALGDGVDGIVSKIISVGNNLYVAGSFTYAGGVLCNGIAKWNGSEWSALGSGISGSIMAIAVDGNNIIVGGDIIQAGGVNVNNIAKWDGTKWSTLGNGIENRVRAILLKDNEVFVGTQCHTSGTDPAKVLAKYDGTNWIALNNELTGPNYGQTGCIVTLATFDGKIYAGGYFKSMNDSRIMGVAIWNNNSWSNLDNGCYNSIDELLVLNDNEIYAVGTSFYKWNGYKWFNTFPENISLTGNVYYNSSYLDGTTVTLSGGKDSAMTTGIDGNFSFSVLSGGTYTITPTKTCYTFSPSYQTFSNVPRNQIQNFSATLLIPKISLSNSFLSFGEIGLSVNSEQNIIISNLDSINSLTIKSIGISGNDRSMFSLVNSTFPMNITALSSNAVKVRFRPTSLGERNAQLFITHSDTAFSPSIVDLSGKGILASASISVDSTNLNFGTLNYSTVSKELSFKIVNTSNFVLEISSIYIDSSDFIFEITDVGPFTIPIAGTKSIRVKLLSDSVGEFFKTLHILNNSYNDPDLKVNLNGKVLGGSLFITPQTIDFGNIGLKSTTKQKTLSIQNNGNINVKIYSITLNTATDTTFRILTQIPSDGILLLPNAIQNINIAFLPTKSGTNSGSLIISNNSESNKSSSIPISGNVIPPSFSLTPDNYQFPTTSISNPSYTKIFTVKNTSTYPITITNRQLQGDSSFKITSGTSNVILNSNQTSDIVIEFFPKSNGEKTTILSVYSSDTTTPSQSVQMKGTGGGGSQMTVSSSVLSFGNCISGVAKDTNFTITNDGNLTMTVSSMTITGNDKSNFSLGNSGTISLDYKQSLKITVRALGTTLGQKSAQLEIINLRDTAKIQLTVNILAPILTKYVDVIAFKPTNINSYTDSTIKIKNTGNALLKIIEIFCDGPSGSLFTPNNASLELSPNEEKNLTIRFQPTAISAVTSRLILRSNDPINPEVRVSLSGSWIEKALAAPLLLSPSNNSQWNPTTLDLTWEQVPNIPKYFVQVSTDTLFGTIIVDDFSTTNKKTVSLSNNTTYFWRVRSSSGTQVSEWSKVFKFTTILPLPNKVVLIQPSNNATQVPIASDLIFKWNKVDGANYYWLQLSQDETFTNNKKFEINERSFINNAYVLKNGSMFNNSDYFWRVKAINTGGEGDWSDIWKFSTQQGKINKPIVDVPAHKSSQVDTSLTIRWNDCGKVSYKFEIYYDKSLTQLVLSNTLNKNYISTNLTKFATTYYWRVKVIDGTNESDWSDVYEFTTLSKPDEKKDWVCDNTIQSRINSFFSDEVNKLYYALTDEGLYLVEYINNNIKLTKVGTNDITFIKSVIVTNNKDIYASGSRGIWKLKNNKWELVYPSPDDIILIYDKIKNEISGNFNSKRVKSSDDGSTWILETVYNFITDNCTVINRVEDRGSKKYVITGQRNSDCITGDVEIFISTNDGITWKNTGFANRDNVTKVNSLTEKTDGNVIIATDKGLYKYEGQIWVKLYFNNSNITAFLQSALGHYYLSLFGTRPSTALFKGTVIDTTNDGIYRSKDDGQTWEYISTSLTDRKISSLNMNSDGQLLVGTENGGLFRTQIKQTNVPPVFTTTVSSTINGSVGQYIRVVFTATDENLDKLTFSISNAPQQSTFEKLTDNTYIFNFIPTNTGEYKNITVNVSDGQSTISQVFTISIISNKLPIVTTTDNKTDYTGIENGVIRFTLNYIDPDNDPITIKYQGTPFTMGARLDSISPNQSIFTWTQTLAGTYPLTFTVSDKIGSTEFKVNLNIRKTNKAPNGFTLVTPVNFSTISLQYPTKPISFNWQKSIDLDGDSIYYRFKLSGLNLAIDSVVLQSQNQNIALSLDIMNKLKLSSAYQWFVVAYDGFDSTISSNSMIFSTSGNVTETGQIENKSNYVLKQNYPNPFNPETMIEYTIPENTFVSIKVYDTYGREIETLVNRNQTQGIYQVTWSPNSARGGLPSGIYYYRMQTEKFSEMKKMIYIR